MSAIATVHRERLLAGVLAALAEREHGSPTIEQIVEKSGVSRANFEENFEDERGCLLAAQDRALSRLAGELIGACAAKSSWPAKVVAAIEVGVEFAAAAPEEARLLLLDAVSIDPVLGAGALQTHEFLTDLLRSGRDQCPQAAAMPDLTERAMIGAATSLVGTRLINGAAMDPRSIGPPLTQLFLTPYVGLEQARRLSLGE